MNGMGLSALPAWSQLSAILPDGSYDPQAADDCGETCVACIVAAVHGVPVSPGSVRSNLANPGRSGLTDGAALVSALAYYAVLAEAESTPAVDLEAVITHWSNQGHPTIVLGEWPDPGGSLHWLLTTGSNSLWHVMNPWGGKRQVLNWADATRLYRGTVVIALAYTHYDMSQQRMSY